MTVFVFYHYSAQGNPSVDPFYVQHLTATLQQLESEDLHYQCEVRYDSNNTEIIWKYLFISCDIMNSLHFQYILLDYVCGHIYQRY